MQENRITDEVTGIFLNQSNKDIDEYGNTESIFTEYWSKPDYKSRLSLLNTVIKVYSHKQAVYRAMILIATLYFNERIKKGHLSYADYVLFRTCLTNALNLAFKYNRDYSKGEYIYSDLDDDELDKLLSFCCFAEMYTGMYSVWSRDNTYLPSNKSLCSTPFQFLRLYGMRHDTGEYPKKDISPRPEWFLAVVESGSFELFGELCPNSDEAYQVLRGMVLSVAHKDGVSNLSKYFRENPFVYRYQRRLVEAFSAQAVRCGKLVLLKD